MQQQSLSRRAPTFGLVVALLTLGFVLMGVTPAQAAASQPTPLKADVSGTVVSTGPGSFALTGAGNSTKLGRLADTGSVHITNVDANGVITDVMIETLTAANGDTLTLRCDQTATPSKPGVLHGVDTWTVIGGTGRFANATGSGTGTTDADLNKGKFTKSMTGSIAFG